jgi:hypothetical protein
VFEPLMRRADLHGLPIALTADCQLGRNSAESLESFSRELRDHLDNHGEADVLQLDLLGGHEYWRSEAALPALVQMLQAEDQSHRLLLVDVIARVNGPAASAALARRALFDLSAKVREAAVKALAQRPRNEFRQLLLDGLRYPWPPVADHAAEALVAQNDREAIRPLLAMLAEPDPAGPTPRTFHAVDPTQIWTVPQAKEPGSITPVALDDGPGDEGRTRFMADLKDDLRSAKGSPQGIYTISEVVRVNHLRNCLLCHAPSLADSDPVRGLVPSPDRPLPRTRRAYYRSPNGDFVRADVTYLRQDFSIMQPEERPGNWPAYQRYDYVVRTRYPTEVELRRTKPATYPQREAVRWALCELVGVRGE